MSDLSGGEGTSSSPRAGLLDHDCAAGDHLAMVHRVLRRLIEEHFGCPLDGITTDERRRWAKALTTDRERGTGGEYEAVMEAIR